MRVLGLMSGTSADGVDAVLVSLAGRSARPRWRILASAHTPYHRTCASALWPWARGPPWTPKAC
jgi:anhydro-N-acetylmuramic acid kinase